MTNRTPTSTENQAEGSPWFDGADVELSTHLSALERPGWVDEPSWRYVSQTIELLTAEYETSRNPSYRAELAYALGRLLESELNDEPLALIAYQAAFKANPSHGPTTSSGRRMFGRIGRWSVVLKFLEAEVRAAEDRTRKSRLLREMGDIYLLRFSRFKESSLLFERADRTNPDNPFTILRRVQLAGLTEHFDDLSRLCEGMAHSQGAAPWTAAAVALGLGDLLRAGEDQKAADLYQALPQAVRGSPELSSLAQRMGPGALGVHPYFEAQRRLIWSVPDPAVRAGLFRSVAAEAAGCGEKAAALEFIAQAVQAQPNQPSHWYVLGLYHEGAGSLLEAAEAFKKCVRLESCRDLRLVYARKLCQLERPSLDTDAGWRAVLELSANDPYALWCHRRALVITSDWETLCGVLLEAASGELDTLVKAASAWLVGLIRIYVLGDAKSALETFEMAHTLAPDSWIAAVHFAAALVESGEPSRVAEVNEGLRGTGPAFDGNTCLQMAQSHGAGMARYLETGENADGALLMRCEQDVLGRQVLVSFGTQKASPELFLTGLSEQLSSSQSVENRADLSRWIALLSLEITGPTLALERIEQSLTLVPQSVSTVELAVDICRQIGSPERLTEHLVMLANLLTDPVRAAECLAEAASITAEDTDRHGLSEQLLMRALKIYPDCVRARRLQSARAHRMGQPDESLELWRVLGRTASVPAVRASCLLESAEIARVKLNSVDDAVTAIDEAEESLNTSLLPILYLERTACTTNAVQVLVDGYERAKRLLGESDLAIEYMLARARILELSGEHYDSLDAYQRVMRVDGANEEALEWLGRWVDETGDVDLLALLQDKWRLAGWFQSRSTGYVVEAARTFLLAGQYEPARRTLRVVLDDHPNHLVALQYLRVMAHREEQTVVARRALIKLAESAVCDELSLRLYVEASEDAISHGEMKLAADCLIEALGRGGAESEDVIGSLRTIAEKNGLWERYADGLLRALESTESSETMEKHALGFLAVARDRLLDPDRALGPMKEALQRSAQPSIRFLRAGGDLAADLGHWSTAAEWYVSARSRSTDEDLRRALGFRLASLYENHLSDNESARTELLHILEFLPNDVLALERLVDLELRSGRLGEARLALTRAINASEEPDKRTALRMKQSALYLNDEQLSADDQLRAARAGLVAASSETPSSPEVYEALANVYGDMSDTAAEQEALRMAVHLTERPADRSRLSERLDDHGDDLTGGAHHKLLRAVACDDPLNPEVIDSLIKEGMADWSLESLMSGLVSPMETARAKDFVEESRAPVPTSVLWADIDLEALQTLRRLTELLPPVFRVAPPVASQQTLNTLLAPLVSNAPVIGVAPLPLFGFFGSNGRLVMSAGLQGAPDDVVEFVVRRGLALASKGLDFVSRWDGGDLDLFVLAIGHCAGVSPVGMDVEGVEELVRIMEPHLAERSWNEGVFRDVSVGLELRSELVGLVDRVRVIADRVALLEQGHPDAAMRAFRYAVRGADSAQARSLLGYQEALARWVITGDFRTLGDISESEQSGESV